jgi:apolipoprotein N-acyltransferase
LTNLINNKLFVMFIAPFFLGTLTALSFSPFNLTLINFFVFPTLLYLILEVKKKIVSKYRKKKSNYYFFYLGCSFGYGFFLAGNYWIAISLTHDDDFKFLIPFAVILIPLFLSIFFGLAVLLTGKFAEKKIYFILLFSLIFSLFEFLRGNILTGFPWNLVSYTWSWSVSNIQILSLIGSYSLSLVSITLFCIPYIFLKSSFSKSKIIFILFFLVIFSSNYLYGNYKINNTKYKFDNNISVKIISPNFTLEEYNNKDEKLQLERLIKISDPDKNKKTLFIWPEGIFYESYLQDIKIYKELFKNNFSDNQLIALGINNFFQSNNSKEYKYFNSLVVVNNDLEIIHVYNKIKLVPFGEFLPLQSFLSKFGFKKITRGYNSFSSGYKRSLFKFDDKLLLPLICYEIIYPGQIKTKKQFPDLMINISEDAWFGKSIGPYQHFSKAVYRSIEEGIFIARSANKGISAYIDPNGRVIKSLEMGETGNIEINFPYFAGSTLFSNYGNKIFALIVLLYIFLILIFKKLKI